MSAANVSAVAVRVSTRAIVRTARTRPARWRHSVWSTTARTSDAIASPQASRIRSRVAVTDRAFAAAAVAGYRRFTQGHFSVAGVYLAVYSLSGLIGTGHYLGVSIRDLSVFQNVFVFLDVALGATVLAFAIWTARQARGEPRTAIV